MALRDLARMDPIEYTHDGQHQDRQKNVKEDFVPWRIPRIPLEIPYHTKDASDEYENTSSIEGIDLAFPKR